MHSTNILTFKKQKSMKKTIWVAAIATLTLTVMSCGNSMKNKIEGKYELDLTPGATYEFASGGKFINIAKPQSMDCTIKSSGMWEVKGDSLYITNDPENISYEYGNSVSEEEKAMIEKITESTSEISPKKFGYQIISVDEKELNIKADDGTTLTYRRIK